MFLALPMEDLGEEPKSQALKSQALESQAAKDLALIAYLQSQGYKKIRKLPDGEWVAIMPLAFTLSVCCGIDEWTPFKYRWCFEDPEEAHLFIDSIQEFDEVPKQKKSLRGHRYLTQPLYVELDEFEHPKW